MICTKALAPVLWVSHWCQYLIININIFIHHQGGAIQPFVFCYPMCETHLYHKMTNCQCSYNHANYEFSNMQAEALNVQYTGSTLFNMQLWCKIKKENRLWDIITAREKGQGNNFNLWIKQNYTENTGAKSKKPIKNVVRRPSSYNIRLPKPGSPLMWWNAPVQTRF